MVKTWRYSRHSIIQSRSIIEPIFASFVLFVLQCIAVTHQSLEQLCVSLVSRTQMVKTWWYTRKCIIQWIWRIESIFRSFVPFALQCIAVTHQSLEQLCISLVTRTQMVKTWRYSRHSIIQSISIIEQIFRPFVPFALEFVLVTLQSLEQLCVSLVSRTQMVKTWWYSRHIIIQWRCSIESIFRSCVPFALQCIAVTHQSLEQLCVSLVSRTQMVKTWRYSRHSKIQWRSIIEPIFAPFVLFIYNEFQLHVSQSVDKSHFALVAQTKAQLKWLNTDDIEGIVSIQWRSIFEQISRPFVPFPLK